nr:hypothetical protein CFP56_56083 [Quercus suber]
MFYGRSAVLPVYQSARIGVLPFSLVLTYFLERTNHTTSTLSSTLTAVLNLLMASIQPNFRAPWTSIAAGVVSSFFVALYPILLLRTYRSILETMGSETVDVMLESSDSEPEDESTHILTPMASVSFSLSTTRAYYTVLHYTSLLSILLLIPCTLLSGEVTHMLRHCYFLDVPWFWFLIFCSSLGGFTVFSSTLLMVLATSPLSTSFVMVPRSVFQLVVLSRLKLPIHSWVGVSLCWASCISFVVTRRQEAKGRLPRALTM